MIVVTSPTSDTRMIRPPDTVKMFSAVDAGRFDVARDTLMPSATSRTLAFWMIVATAQAPRISRFAGPRCTVRSWKTAATNPDAPTDTFRYTFWSGSWLVNTVNTVVPDVCVTAFDAEIAFFTHAAVPLVAVLV